MKKQTKVLLIISLILIAVGVAAFVGAMAVLSWDFGSIGGSGYETNTYEIDDDFDSLSISLAADDISIRPAKDEKCSIECYERKNAKRSAGVSDNTLEIKSEDKRSWFEWFTFFSSDSPKMTVYLPKKDYYALSISTETGDISITGGLTFGSVDITGATGDVYCGASVDGQESIMLSTGDIEIYDASAKGLDLETSTGRIAVGSVKCDGPLSVKVSTGDVELTDIECSSMGSTGSTGRIYMTDTTAKGSFNIERSTGDITLDRCDAEQLYIRTTTGDVRGVLLSEKVFTTNTSTGDVKVPTTTGGGVCDITTSTGDIKMDIAEPKE